MSHLDMLYIWKRWELAVITYVQHKCTYFLKIIQTFLSKKNTMMLVSNVVRTDLNIENFQWKCAMEFTAFTIMYYICIYRLHISLEKERPIFRVNVHKCHVNMHLHEAILNKDKRENICSVIVLQVFYFEGRTNKQIRDTIIGSTMG